jgi:V/A-type H+-transporting ATPase subunit E
MAEDIKGLIEKIQQEGIKAAEDKAREIESAAKKEAEAIIKKAQADVNKLLAEAKEKIATEEKSSRTLLSQAGRDLLLSLRKEINALLDKIIQARVREALSAEEISKIIFSLIKDYKGQDKEEIIVSLKKEDLEKLEKHFLGELKEHSKKGITLKPSEDILGGFTISFDAGKSQFDFTDQALAGYISLYLKPKLGTILQEDKKT